MTQLAHDRAIARDNGLNSLGFAKPPAQTRVVVAMSGGVDSSVVAAKLKSEGYDVIGVTLQLYDHGAALAKKGACCAGQDIHDARRVAERMGFPHYVLDYENKFRESVIDEFADAYLAGATPVPCIRCNERVKFRDLLETARDLDADCMATGHYIQRKTGADRAELHMAADPARDQSYFLFSTTQEQLDFLRFPLGHLASKTETRALASEYGLSVADKPDSQDICFVPNGDYASVIEKLRPGAADPGEIVDTNGNTLGRHDGVIHYTVGQRRGLGIGGLSEPLYVIRLDPETRQVVVGPKSALATSIVPITEVNWLGDQPFEGEIPCLVRIRSTRPPRPAILRPVDRTRAEVELLDAEEGVSPGQACVFYETGGTRVLGGGWITLRRRRAA
ncbi:tRNA 2-thiouridine(34) synthase MnmA [Paracoccus onubensis]|uniref:tRNA 2-thiouridine(34) synthase MnmA n=1 Tax=Paracoccus onubensis TaxID=1675788 RepID=UPI0027309F92|nr:tRNA 2-thiouridine(34) synthase MnmA [Paracoccus onubensis]MDP0927321.1 tRNA 2-thiouridine(34) synthase MnmA [Paracoccus onubensis]